MSSPSVEKQQYQFQAEIQSLLHLLSHSLYQNRAIAIRELISNASDALDKFRHLRLTNDAVSDESELLIKLEPDADAKTLTIRDNGVGMTRDELVENLGTIAHSGSLAFLKELASRDEKDVDLSLIGQFGVGFYSAFMLADRVEVETRGWSADEAYCWESDGTGAFTIEAVPDVERGTAVRLYLKEEFASDFTSPDFLQRVVRRYSSFVPHPVHIGEEVANDQRPIWVEQKANVSDEDYVGFYRYLSHSTDEEPLWHLHTNVEGTIQYHALLFCPPTNFELLGMGRDERGVHLCAKRVLVSDDCRDVLPDYLRFLRGVVDSADLPLNVSRETLQDDAVFMEIRKTLTPKVLKSLERFAKKEPEKYAAFYDQFGMVLREGVVQDMLLRDQVAKLLRFHSTQTVEEAGDAEPGRTSLDEYIERSDEGQAIYFLSGTDLRTLARNPHLELVRSKGREVLLLDDPIDEYLLSMLGRYGERDIVSVDAADLDLDAKADDTTDGDDESKTESRPEPPSGFEALLALFKESLEGQVQDVRRSSRLTDSPACLVTPGGGLSAGLHRVFKMSGQAVPPRERILEVNAESDLVQRFAALTANPQNVGFLRDAAQQLFADALLLDGDLPSPTEQAERSRRLLKELAESRSSVITEG